MAVWTDSALEADILPSNCMGSPEQSTTAHGIWSTAWSRVIYHAIA